MAELFIAPVGVRQFEFDIDKLKNLDIPERWVSLYVQRGGIWVKDDLRNCPKGHRSYMPLEHADHFNGLVVCECGGRIIE